MNRRAFFTKIVAAVCGVSAVRAFGWTRGRVVVDEWHRHISQWHLGHSIAAASRAGQVVVLDGKAVTRSVVERILAEKHGAAV